MNVDILIKNASELLTCKPLNLKKPKVGKELSDLGLIQDGAIAIKNGKIIFVGKTNKVRFNAKKVIDAKNKVVMPGFVDCHTHAIFAGSREDEFLMKLQGKSYLEILKSGGGILSTVEKTRKATRRELYKETEKRLKKMLEYGTTTVEIKSGYGLTFKDEKKILEVADELAKKLPINVVKTYLGAHVAPENVSREKYICEVLNSLEKLKDYAEFCDVFCERGAFSLKETNRILTYAKHLGYKLKLHAEQLSKLDSPKLASNLGAVSADHLEHISENGIKALAQGGIIGVLLPGATFFLNKEKYPPTRKLIESGVPIAIASDFNPGTCPSFNMQLMISLACLKMKLTPAEAINAACINAAFAIDRGHEIGSLEVGKKADILLLDIDNHKKLPYFFGVNLVSRVIKSGIVVNANSL